MATVTTKVEIAARPALARSLFLDFASIPKYHTGHFTSITILEDAASGTTSGTLQSAAVGENLKAGDKLRIGLAGGMSFKAKVIENTPERFTWQGGWTYVMIGEHTFRFEPSSTIKDGTSLTHAETFTGSLVSLCRPFLGKDEDRKSPGFEKFNVDFKKWAEEKANQVQP